MLDVVSRREWGARPPRSVTTLPWSAIDTFYVHYTAAFSDEFGDPKARMRGVQNFHMDDPERKWSDFAYSHAFTRGGVILEGRGWCVRTAATGIENGHSLAFVFLGTDKAGRDDVTPAGREALRKLVNEGMRLKGSRNIRVKGHTEARDPAGLTDCPGPELLSYIHQQNEIGWRIKEPAVKYPRHFYLFAAWYLGEGAFKNYKPHDLKVRPKQLPPRFSPQMAAYRAALRHFLAQRKKHRA